MKKFLVIISVCVTLFSIYMVINKKDDVKPVVLQENVFFDLDDYNIFYLNLEEVTITNKTLSQYVNNDMTIIKLVPYVNPIYRDKIGYMTYHFNTESYKKNITKFKTEYINKIKQSGYLEDFSDFEVNGIKINEIEIYAKGSDVVNLFYKMPYIKYKNYLDENYNYFDF